jgi:hypothetical protein
MSRGADLGDRMKSERGERAHETLALTLAHQVKAVSMGERQGEPGAAL